MKGQVQENGPLVFESLVSLIPSDLVEFTDEEGYGRYLDLHDCYLKYINLKASEVRPRRGESGSDSQRESGRWAGLLDIQQLVSSLYFVTVREILKRQCGFFS